jgi:hypothetical protein
MWTLVMLIAAPILMHGADDAPKLSQDIKGQWTVAIEAATAKTDDGRPLSRPSLSGTMTLRVDGDTVTGTFEHATEQPTTLELSGTLKDGRLRVATRWQERQESSGGRSRVFRTRWVFDGTQADGGLRGTCYLEVEGRAERVTQPWTGRRHRI